MQETNIILTVIMFVGLYPVLPILYFFQMAALEEQKGSLFGIRISREWLTDQEKEEIIQTYKKKMKRILAVMALIPLATPLIPYTSVSLTVWMIWTLALIGVCCLPYAQSFNRVKAIKQSRAVPSECETPSFYEIREAGHIRTLRPGELLPLAALNLGLAACALLCLHGQRLWSYGVIIAVYAAFNLFLMGCALWTDRMKAQVISRDSDVNVNFSRANKKLWKRFWLANCCLMTGFTAVLLFYFLRPHPSDRTGFWLCMLGSITLCLISLAFTCLLGARKEKLKRLYADKRDPLLEEQEEKGWIGGILYYNPGDRRAIVEKRVGLGTTVNMATPIGKTFSALTVLALLAIPLSCVWLLLEEFTPLNLTLQGETLVAEHLNTEYAVPLDSILSAALCTELPKGSKVHGTNMSTLEKGTFRNSAEGRVEKCLNPMAEAFLRIETESNVYYFSGYTEEATLEIYQALCAMLPPGTTR